MDYNKLIVTTLNSLGASKTCMGYDYIVYGLILLFQDKRRIAGIVKSLYVDIADYYDTTWNCVEKNIRWLVKEVWNENNDEILHTVFNKTSSDPRITNKQFFRDMYEYIQGIPDWQNVMSSELVCPITHQYCKAFADYCMGDNTKQDEE